VCDDVVHINTFLALNYHVHTQKIQVKWVYHIFNSTDGFVTISFFSRYIASETTLVLVHALLANSAICTLLARAHV
jgi:hypothetical protein